ncbi:unnamed protein product [Clonostachys byssicola]|uniref:Major facilitator superfamily (MFS) profile domain-containing protein n=1 Tax=Clonostachys byssicola TaxID=160290 RepID=A0A9N9UCU8_9HYPO|nr:unnamed protein product [Clonostachys byssicola]
MGSVELGNQTSSANQHMDQTQAARGQSPSQDEKRDPKTPLGVFENQSSVDEPCTRTVIKWKHGDPENPYNFSKTKKSAILVSAICLLVNSTMGSSLPSNAIPYILHEWSVTTQEQVILSISVYLIGYVLGPIIWGPLSEHIGRRNITITTFVLFLIWTMAAPLAPSWPSFLIFRFLAGAVGGAPIAVTVGIMCDIYSDPRERGTSMALFMLPNLFGPLLAPVISGYCSTTIGWRWTFWIALIYGSACLPAILWVPETFGPALLTRRAKKIREADPTAQIFSRAELEPRDSKQLVTRVLTRPINMLVSELIVSSTCAYLALCYAIFYMTFQAFPLIFRDLYGLSPGVTGLCFLPVGAGCIMALPIAFLWDDYLSSSKARGDPWTKKQENYRLPLSIAGGPMFAISLFWLGWSARKDVSFVVPMLAGVPFGCGFTLIFIAMLNYLTDAYEIYSASANAASSGTRSILAVVLPFATLPMFGRLGIAGACSLLGGLSGIMCFIPFVFIWKGERIRARSKFCIALKAQKCEMGERSKGIESSGQ